MVNDVVEQLAESLAPAMERHYAKQWGLGYKHSASGTPISQGYSHGPGGNFSFPGVDPTVFHTVVGVRGILGQLAATPSVFTNPTFYTLTGVQGDTGSEPATPCEAAPVAGLKKSCLLTAPFGLYKRDTPELELNRLGQRTDRADPMDLALVGSPIHQAGIFATGPGDPSVPRDLLRNEISQKFWELGVSLHRLLSRQLWAGSPANNNVGLGYREFAGFETLIVTGHVDAENGQACPAVDPDIKDFNYLRIDQQGTALVDAIAEMYHYVKTLAETTGVAPVRWVLAMRPQLFYELTSVWPCSYLTYRCQVSGNQQVQINAEEQVKFRDEMRAGRYLLIDGERIPVIIDDGITEDTNTTNANVTSGCFASDIFLIPMSVVGGQAVTFMEYFDYRNPSLAAALGAEKMALAKVDGPWLVTVTQLRQCIAWEAKVEPRLIMRTLWLAGRLQNVQYCPAQHEREPFPDDPYFVDGGRTTRPGPSLHNVWNP